MKNSMVFMFTMLRFTLFSQNWSIEPQFQVAIVKDVKWGEKYSGVGATNWFQPRNNVYTGILVPIAYSIKNNIIRVGVGMNFTSLKGITQRNYITNYKNDTYLLYNTGKLFYFEVPISYGYKFDIGEKKIFKIRPKFSLINMFISRKIVNDFGENFALDFRSVDYYTYQLYASAGVEFWFKHYFFGLFYSTALTDLNRNFKGLKLAQIKLTMGYEISFKKKEKAKK